MTQYKFIITDISRAHSSGYENSSKKIFETIEQVAEYLQNTWYNDFCEGYGFPEEWDEADMNCPFPSKDEFSLDKIKQKIANTKFKRQIVLFGPRSDFCCLVPNELILDQITI